MCWYNTFSEYTKPFIDIDLIFSSCFTFHYFILHFRTNYFFKLLIFSASQELSNCADILLREAERARDLGMELSREIDELRRGLETVIGDCVSQDRSVCATVNPVGLTVTLRIEQVI